jgi:hypothetical protein
MLGHPGKKDGGEEVVSVKQSTNVLSWMRLSYPTTKIIMEEIDMLLPWRWLKQSGHSFTSL